MENSKYKVIDQVSPSFCLAKWLQVTLNLYNGTNHSCHHPKRHKTPLSELENNASSLHNTNFKKQQRKLMLEGQRPSECSYCWNIEDSNESNISDRYIKSTDPWAYPHLKQVKNLKWDENIDPTYVEVMFDNHCNFSCSYCLSDVSSSISREIKKFGPLNVRDPSHRMPSKEVNYGRDNNPYIDAFWNWFPKLSESLEVLRITGGEPFLTSNTLKVVEYLKQNPRPNLTLAINSNLGISREIITKHFDKIKTLIEKNSIKDFDFFTSIDSIGKQAEYIRQGLDSNQYFENLKYTLETFPNQRVILMCTFNILSIANFQNLLIEVKNLKENYSNLILDISYLRDPYYLSVYSADDELINTMKNSLKFMEENFNKYETQKFKRIVYWLLSPRDNSKINYYRSDFYNFVNDFDKRYGKNFLDIFPEMYLFYKKCRKAAAFMQLPV